MIKYGKVKSSFSISTKRNLCLKGACLGTNYKKSGYYIYVVGLILT